MDIGPEPVDDQRSSEMENEGPWWASIHQPPEMSREQIEQVTEVSPPPVEDAQTHPHSAYENPPLVENSIPSDSLPAESLDAGNAPLAPVVLSPSEGATRGPKEITFEGMAEPGCTVRLLDWALPVAETASESSGYWKLRLPWIEPGSHMYAALCVDGEGRESPTCRPFLLEVRTDDPSSARTAATPAPGHMDPVPLSPIPDDPSPVPDREHTTELPSTGDEDQTFDLQLPADIPLAPSVTESLEAPLNDGSTIPPARDSEQISTTDAADAEVSATETEQSIEAVGFPPARESILHSLSAPSVSPEPISRGSGESVRAQGLAPRTSARPLPLDSVLVAALLIVLAAMGVLLFQSRLTGGRPSAASISLAAGLKPPPRHAPAPRRAWHFNPPAKGTRTVVITLYNGGRSRETALVMTPTRTVWRVRMPPKSEAEAVLSRSSAAKALTVESSAPIVSWRTAFRPHGLVRSYGIAGP